MSLPPWGTSEGPGQPGPEPEGGPSWGSPGALTRYAILVEQNIGSGENYRWAVQPEPWLLDAGTSAEQARAMMFELARNFAPNNPWSPKGRQIFRVNQDSYLVLVPGMSKTFHFRITLVEQIGP